MHNKTTVYVKRKVARSGDIDAKSKKIAQQHTKAKKAEHCLDKPVTESHTKTHIHTSKEQTGSRQQ